MDPDEIGAVQTFHINVSLHLDLPLTALDKTHIHLNFFQAHGPRFKGARKQSLPYEIC